MRTHTWLTTPPGSEPVALSGPDVSDELYVPGVALPAEPRVAGKYRKLIVVLTAVAALSGAALIAWNIITSGQSFDPALDQQPGQIGSSNQDPTLQVPANPGS